MKKAALRFMAGALVMAALALLVSGGHVAGNGHQIARAGIVLVLVGLAVYL